MPSIDRAFLSRRLRAANPRSQLAGALDRSGRIDERELSETLARHPPGQGELPVLQGVLAVLRGSSFFDRAVIGGIKSATSLAGRLLRRTPLLGTETEWTQRLSSPCGAPCFSADRKLLFQGTFSGILHALATDTGEEAWTVKLPGNCNSMETPALSPDGETLAVAVSGSSYFGGLHQVDASTGAIRWSQDGKPTAQFGTRWGAPCVGPDGTVYAAMLDCSKIAALDGETGQLKFTLPVPEMKGSSTTPRVSADGSQLFFPYFGPQGPHQVAFDLDLLSKLWERDKVAPGTKSQATLSPDGKTLYWLTGRTLSAFDAFDGEPRWELETRSYNPNLTLSTSTSGKYVAVPVKGGLDLHSSTTGERLRSITTAELANAAPLEDFLAAAFTEHDEALIAHDAHGNALRIVLPDGEPQPVVTARRSHRLGYTGQMAIEPGGRWLYGQCQQGLYALELAPGSKG
jgi:hypothetical protein